MSFDHVHRIVRLSGCWIGIASYVPSLIAGFFTNNNHKYNFWGEVKILEILKNGALKYMVYYYEPQWYVCIINVNNRQILIAYVHHNLIFSFLISYSCIHVVIQLPLQIKSIHIVSYSSFNSLSLFSFLLYICVQKF